MSKFRIGLEHDFFKKIVIRHVLGQLLVLCFVFDNLTCTDGSGFFKGKSNLKKHFRFKCKQVNPDLSCCYKYKLIIFGTYFLKSNNLYPMPFVWSKAELFNSQLYMWEGGGAGLKLSSYRVIHKSCEIVQKRVRGSKFQKLPTWFYGCGQLMCKNSYFQKQESQLLPLPAPNLLQIMVSIFVPHRGG